MLEFFKALFGLNADAKALREQSKRMVDSATSIADDFETIASASRQFRQQALPTEMGEFIDLPSLEVIDEPPVRKPPKPNGKTRKTRTTVKSR